ncbi:DUF4280 domain-containing protein [Flavobacterium procerum]|uniref:DUF4280 domain-containing protein n=1 Tax=Flavobacterium procerum TaxID=1455569 RepID=A0ABV6BRV3_9FLAO
MAKYICNGAKCKCTLSDSEGTLMVNSQNKIFIQNKLMATENEKTFLPHFVSCKKTDPPTPCVPVIDAPWSSAKSDVFQTQNKGLLEDSECQCTQGGTISIVDSKQSATNNVILGDYSSKPTEISNVYVKIRTLEDYKGEFGFDWLDLDPETMEIQKIQGVPFENIEYFYRKGNTPADLGDIVAVRSDTDKQDAKQAIKENYGFTNFYNHVDIPFVLLQPNPDPEVFIKLSLEVFFKGTPQDDYISITGDDYYEFEIVGGEKDKKTTRKKITSNEKLLLKVKCLKESLDIKYAFVHTGALGPREVGGLNMMENKVLELKFRVIALVSNEGNPSEKAKALFKKFKDGEITKYLNENSLNQAGYKVVIENQEMFTNLDNPSVNLDNYLYAFDKKDWESKSYYRLENNIGMLFYKIDVDSGKKNDEGEPIMITKSIDYVTIEEYTKKLKVKYSGGLIILGDGKAMNNEAVAFSRTEPLNHDTIFVYNNTNKKDTYAHEISHMLGLPHLFYHLEEMNDYNIIRNNILGNGEPELIDGRKNPLYIAGILKTIKKTETSSHDKYSQVNLFGKKNDLINSLDSIITKYESIKDKNIEDKKEVKAKYKNYPDSYKINSSQTKKQYIDVCDTWIDFANTLIGENTLAKENLSDKKDSGYIQLNVVGNFLKKDFLKLLNQSLKYYNLVINQINSNYIMFKQSSTDKLITKNFMDYHNNDKRLFLMRNQIIIMRNDINNYV